MAVLKPTALTGRVVFLGVVEDREASLRSKAVDRVAASFAGLAGECHSGLTRPACSRVSEQYAKGREIRNARQISVLSVEELDATALEMGLRYLDPRWLGANIVLEGIPDLTLLPPSARLVFESGAALTIDMENAPCAFPAREIEREHPGKGLLWKAAARHRRGVTAWVEAEGELALGAVARLHVPPQRLYPPLIEGEAGRATT